MNPLSSRLESRLKEVNNNRVSPPASVQHDNRRYALDGPAEKLMRQINLRTVCKVEATVGGERRFGTGMLLKGGLVLTNFHVLPDECENPRVIFFKKPYDGRKIHSIPIDRGRCWVGSPSIPQRQLSADQKHLDFRVAALKITKEVVKLERLAKYSILDFEDNGFPPCCKQVFVAYCAPPSEAVLNGRLIKAQGEVLNDADAGDYASRIQFQADGRPVPGASGSVIFGCEKNASNLQLDPFALLCHGPWSQRQDFLGVSFKKMGGFFDLDENREQKKEVARAEKIYERANRVFPIRNKLSSQNEIIGSSFLLSHTDLVACGELLAGINAKDIIFSTLEGDTVTVKKTSRTYKSKSSHQSYRVFSISGDRPSSLKKIQMSGSPELIIPYKLEDVKPGPHSCLIYHKRKEYKINNSSLETRVLICKEWEMSRKQRETFSLTSSDKECSGTIGQISPGGSLLDKKGNLIGMFKQYRGKKLFIAPIVEDLCEEGFHKN